MFLSLTRCQAAGCYSGFTAPAAAAAAARARGTPAAFAHDTAGNAALVSRVVASLIKDARDQVCIDQVDSGCVRGALL
jgi:hypothetical protein